MYDEDLHGQLHLKLPRAMVREIDQRAHELTMSRSDYVRVVLKLALEDRDIVFGARRGEKAVRRRRTNAEIEAATRAEASAPATTTTTDQSTYHWVDADDDGA